jgi:transposase
MQADAYAGFNRLYEADRNGGPIIEAACWAHTRRKFFDLARINKAPIAYSLKRWTALTRFLNDGRLCMTNNAAERELRAIARTPQLDLRPAGSRPLHAHCHRQA